MWTTEILIKFYMLFIYEGQVVQETVASRSLAFKHTAMVNTMDRRIEKIRRKDVGDSFTYKYKDENTYNIFVTERVLKIINSGMQSFEYMHEKFGKIAEKKSLLSRPNTTTPPVQSPSVPEKPSDKTPDENVTVKKTESYTDKPVLPPKFNKLKSRSGKKGKKK